MDIQAILRLARAGKNNSYIADNLQLDRRTVGKYRRFFAAQGYLTGPLPDLATLEAAVRQHLPAKRKGRHSKMTAWDKDVRHYLDRGLTPRLIFQKLQEQEGFDASESAVYRYVRRLQPATPKVTIRVETPPGEEAQVDFGAAGTLWDPVNRQERRAWVFTMVLSWSRHMYAEFVFDQKVTTWLSCHNHAFAFFGGVPQRLKIDNLKAAIIRACVEDPQVQRAYAECAEHYNFRIDPCRPYTPQHKGKVERGAVAYIKGSFCPLLVPGASRTQANDTLRQWLMTTAGRREHGTTRVAPLARFAEEQSHLQPLLAGRFEPSIWKTVKLHRDCHVVFEKSYYSAPFRLVDQTLQLRATLHQVELYNSDMHLVAAHSRAHEAGQRRTVRDHLPPHKAAGLLPSRAELQQQAAAIGPHTAAVAQQLLAERPLERSRMVQRILRLAERYDAVRLERACARGRHYDDVRYQTLKRILQRGLEAGEIPSPPTMEDETLRFVRTEAEFADAFRARAQEAAS